MARLNREMIERAKATIALYPQKRSALLPLLHLAQEQDGHLTEDVLEHVAELVELLPAEVLSVASFYDMFHLQPVGKHLIEVCTNVACALNGAGAVVEEFEQQLGIHAGESSEDGQYTLRTVECLGGCGTAPTVAVNNRFREFFERSQVKPLLQELKATPVGWTEGEGQV